MLIQELEVVKLILFLILGFVFVDEVLQLMQLLEPSLDPQFGHLVLQLRAQLAYLLVTRVLGLHLLLLLLGLRGHNLDIDL